MIVLFTFKIKVMVEYAELHELREKGIKRVINHGINDFGFIERTIVCEDNSVWDYLAEDNLYQKRVDKDE
jgi:hypothetical protein